MSNYIGVFICFVYGMLDNFWEVEVFLFYIWFVYVFLVLFECDVVCVFDWMGLMVQGIGGGIKIGEVLVDFNKWYVVCVIYFCICVMILLDGYDIGGLEVFGVEMV